MSRESQRAASPIREPSPLRPPGSWQEGAKGSPRGVTFAAEKAEAEKQLAAGEIEVDEISEAAEEAQAEAKAGAVPPWKKKQKRPFWKKGPARLKGKGKGKSKGKGKTKDRDKGKGKGKTQERAPPKEGQKNNEEAPVRKVRIAGRRDLPERLR